MRSETSRFFCFMRSDSRWNGGKENGRNEPAADIFTRNAVLSSLPRVGVVSDGTLSHGRTVHCRYSSVVRKKLRQPVNLYEMFWSGYLNGAAYSFRLTGRQ